jgi:hypothetical protein
MKVLLPSCTVEPNESCPISRRNSFAKDTKSRSSPAVTPSVGEFAPLPAERPRYNPISYHNGSVWPHDNALIAAGLARCGFKEMAGEILSGLLAVSTFVDLHRLPELFCGLERRTREGPTLYLVACAPQA